MMDDWFDDKEKGRYPVIGAVDEQNRLLGFASYGPFRSRPAYKYTVEHSVYVDKDCRGRGVGKLLLAAIVERARQQQYHNVIGGIDAENDVSIALHKQFGFRILRAGQPGRLQVRPLARSRLLPADSRDARAAC